MKNQEIAKLTPDGVEDRIIDANGRFCPEDYYHDIANIAADLLRELRPHLRGDNRTMADLIINEVK